MLTKQIKDRTVKDIFVDLLGEENANQVLAKIQQEYDKGTRGEALRDFAETVIKQNLDLKPEPLKLLIAAIAVIVI